MDSKKIINKKNIIIIVTIILILILVISGAYFYKNYENNLNNQNKSTDTNVSYDEQKGIKKSSSTKTAIASSNAVPEIDTTNMFSNKDLEQSPNLEGATYLAVTDNNDLKITSGGVYVIKGTATEVSIYVEAGKEEKVQIILDGVNITNSSKPCIYVAQADKVFVTTTNSENTMKVTGNFNYSVNTSADAVIFSKETLTLNGTGTLNITSTANGITSKDTLKATGGTWIINASNHGLEANDAVEINNGEFSITAKKDDIQCENNDDQTKGYVYISGGTFTLKAGDDGIHAQTIAQITGGTINITAAEGIEATYVKIDDGTIKISASDDGINAAQKSTAYGIAIVINGGNIDISMGQGDTDAIDSNGNLTINGGTVNITAQSAFDYDGSGEMNGGTVTVNGSEVTTLTNSMMGGGKGGMQNNGQMPNKGQMPNENMQKQNKNKKNI